ncbi:DUF805 domain-containing protein [Caballeronia sp. LZ062]|uniref:DUF805 domain-containing protein n=1 Tax=unclassified Caballeronia TaxID=2646786 RepID=UPI002866551C|nr:MULTISPECIES: DUF805 domain-containing protein [unclassified Caballeronia]MDR5854950.1 DUF805 domain-containing protein [Caballeronia sp. LZ050]MDR5870521.1 DUF805 domain-containing protein [Caballeronia sp. LZ062]
MKSWLKRRLTPNGRASRREYAITTCIFTFIVIAIKIADVGGLIGTDLMPTLVAIAFVLLLFWTESAVIVRRLHDVGLSGWWWFLLTVPFVGNAGVALLFFVGPDKFSRSARYPDPRDPESL